MIELPEAAVLANQLNKKVKGRKIVRVIAAHSPHKFALVEIRVDDAIIVLSDGANLRYHYDNKELPKKHQLLIELDNSTFLTVSIQMYGGVLCFKEGTCNNKYYPTAKEKPSPLSKKFNEKYFNSIISDVDLQNKSVKFLLATEQRIPGLGNGVLQDILYNAKIHPKRKVATLSDKEKDKLHYSLKTVLMDMIEKGGRDTEKDLFGNNGGYITKLSKNTAGKPCSNCGSTIKKESYMGGSIYYRSKCQKL
jgi:formamidopyrimidine-DNA glycosylase